MSEFRTNLSRYIREVQAGEEIEVLHRGKLVARLVPLAPSRNDDQAADHRGVRSAARHQERPQESR